MKNKKDFETEEKPTVDLPDIQFDGDSDTVEKPINVVEEPKPEPDIQSVAKVDTSQTPQTLKLVSEGDAYILDRMKSQPKTIDDVAMLKPKQYALGKHRLSLPEELNQYENRFAFRWVNKKKRALDEAIDLKSWVIVNRALFKDIPEHLFASSGGIEKGDVILMFYSKELQKAYHASNALKAKKLRTSTPMLKNDLPDVEKGRAGFYKPKDTTSGEDTPMAVKQGRDF